MQKPQIMRATSLLAMGATFLLLSACSPVQFFGNQTDNPSITPEGPVSPTPTVTPSPSPSPTATPTQDISTSKTVEPKSQKVDLILVIDDSNSMLPDNQKLAARLSNFVTTLQNSAIDWQMCVTVTRAIPITSTQTAWGASMYWQNSATPSSSLGIVLKKGTPNLSSIFQYTINYINAGWVGSDDERAIKAAYHHVYNGDYHYSDASGCYRPDAAIAYIIISDEDERSVGGDKSQEFYVGETKALEKEDKPAEFVSYVKQTFGENQRFTVNSIIVKPGDSACKAQQDSGSAKSHYGFRYAELSNMTGGGIGSICDSDFSSNLNLFFQKITNSLSSIPLECVPVGAVTVNVVPSVGAISYQISGMNLILNPAVSEGHTINLSYKCPVNRSPSSVGEAISEAPSFFMRIVNFFKGLFS